MENVYPPIAKKTPFIKAKQAMDDIFPGDHFSGSIPSDQKVNISPMDDFPSELIGGFPSSLPEMGPFPPSL